MHLSAPVSRPARFFRGWAASAVCILCAATSHYSVHPDPPSPLLLAVAFALAGVVCVALAGRRMGALRTGCAVLASQLPFHLVFSGGAAAAGGGYDAADPAHAHHGHAELVQAVAAHGDAVAGHAAMPQGAMLWAHLVAAAVTFVLLRHAEDGWWRLAEATSRLLFTAVLLLRAALVPCRAPRPVPLAYLLPPRTWSPVRVISRRGPPLLSI